MARPRFNQTLTVDAATKAAWCREIRALPDGGRYEMTLAPRKAGDDVLRSDNANRWYWRNVVQPLAEFLMDQEVELGTMERAKDYAHYEIIVPRILGIQRRNFGGITIETPYPTHTLTREQFHDFAERADVFVQSFISWSEFEDDVLHAAPSASAGGRT